MNNNNGFAEALKEINTLLKVNKRVELDVLEEAANYFIEKLKPRIPISDKNKTHLRDSLKVVVKDDMVSVEFEDDAWYWYLAEHGHLVATSGKSLDRTGVATGRKRRARGGTGKQRVKGAHFVQNTFDGEGDKIAEIMTNKIINKMGG